MSKGNTCKRCHGRNRHTDECIAEGKRLKELAVTKITEQQFLEMEVRELADWITDNLMDGKWPYARTGKDGEMLPPKYDDDYNAMHRVIEKMRKEHDCIVQLVFYSERTGCQISHTNHVPCRNITSEWWAYNDDAPLAVYLAAGRALGRIE
jgi:hypothetical protein